ncbi:3260_t:CDS:10, partial [Acaulospora colombiana]
VKRTVVVKQVINAAPSKDKNIVGASTRRPTLIVRPFTAAKSAKGIMDSDAKAIEKSLRKVYRVATSIWYKEEDLTEKTHNDPTKGIFTRATGFKMHPKEGVHENTIAVVEAGLNSLCFTNMGREDSKFLFDEQEIPEVALAEGEIGFICTFRGTTLPLPFPHDGTFNEFLDLMRNKFDHSPEWVEYFDPMIEKRITVVDDQDWRLAKSINIRMKRPKSDKKERNANIAHPSFVKKVPATRLAGEQVMLSFKQMSGNLEACQYVLGENPPNELFEHMIKDESDQHTKSHYVQFHMALAVRESVVRDYALYSNDYLLNLRNWLLNYCLQHTEMVSYVQNQLLHTVSVMIKRGLEDYHDGEKHSILTNIQTLVSAGGYSQLVGMGLANALVDEFSSSKASNVGLPWDFHKKCKDFFEETYLLPIFDQVLRVLHQQLQIYTANGTQYSQPYHNGHISHHDLSRDALLAISINLAEKILCWDFVSKNDSLLAGTFSDDKDDIIEDELFITAKTREFPASWRGHMMHGEVLRLFFRVILIIFQSTINLSFTFVNDLSSNITERLASPEYGPSLLGISQMTRRLLCTIPLPTLCSVPEFQNFLHEIAQLTATCLRESATVKDGYGYLVEDSTWSLEAFDEFLAVWVKLAQEAQSYQNQYENQTMSSFNPAVFMAFLGEASYHITATYIDTRMEMAGCSNDEDEEINNFKDWITYEDQLISIAILARIVGQRVLDKLQVLLHERAAQLRAFFMAVADNKSSVFAADCTIMYLQESIHWLILISAFVLADAGEGEQPLVPNDLMQLSMSQSNLGKNHDQIVLLVNTISGILDLPESQGEGLRILEYLIGKIKINFILWNSDPGPLSQTMAIITSGASDEELKHHYFQMITSAIEKRFLTVLQRPDFDSVYQQADVMAEVQNALEVMFDGLALASDISNTELIYSFCSKYFDFMVKLLHYYQNCPEVGFLVLQFFNSFVTYQDFGSLSAEHSKYIYQTMVNLFKTYALANLGKKRIESTEEAEEEPYADISIMLDMLSGIMASEFREYLYDDAQKNQATTEFDVPSVVLYGVDFIIPTINTSMLKAITPLALFAHNEERKKGRAVVQYLYAPLDRLLHIVLECFLFKDFEADLLEPASETLVALICARRESYNTLVQTLISQQTTPGIQSRLHDAFSVLSAAIPQTLPEVIIQRRDVSGFREVLFRFLMNVRGFLRVK